MITAELVIITFSAELPCSNETVKAPLVLDLETTTEFKDYDDFNVANELSSPSFESFVEKATPALIVVGSIGAVILLLSIFICAVAYCNSQNEIKHTQSNL